jgi:hypothetical protein
VPPPVIRAADVPWPDLDALEAVPGEAKPFAGAAPAASRFDLRALQARWHPDRFSQKFGARLAAEERDEVLRRVTAVAARINALRDAAGQGGAAE